VQHKRYFTAGFDWPIHRGEMVMPALLWVAFWSSMMATAACLGEAPIAPKKEDLPSGD